MKKIIVQDINCSNEEKLEFIGKELTKIIGEDNFDTIFDENRTNINFDNKK